MKLNIKHHLATDTISVTWAHRESEKCSAWCSSHNTGWDMTPEQWLEVIGEVQRKIDLLQSCQTKWEQCREEFEAGRLAALAAELAKGQAADADLAAKIAEHGPAT